MDGAGPAGLYVGWIGDCQVTLVSKGIDKKKKHFITEKLHKPDVPSEKLRIYNHRGEIRETSDGL